MNRGILQFDESVGGDVANREEIKRVHARIVLWRKMLSDELKHIVKGEVDASDSSRA